MKRIALYDGKCSLCKESKKIFQKLDVLNQVEWISLQQYNEENGECDFHPVELRKELHLLLPSGKALKGFFAVRSVLLRSPYSFVFALPLYIPFVHLIGSPIYRWIAKNRHKFLKRKCDDGSCSL
ncbi:thiol-disulfide oxidoreductase DCC family protein [Cytobacillus sp. FJAT-54145]|uniref:Thiol-disulfide oxidoreductase DCC family protein n=1 Tax=Cytobacillus spartinae TaxID=3299023 RepID=A0ABW6KGE4_9BACI